MPLSSRRFEINLGIIGACVPMMRPFIRYIHARISSKSTSHHFRSASIPSAKSHWYTNIWGRHSVAAIRPYATDAKPRPSSRQNLFKIPQMLAHIEHTDTAETPDFPLQRIQKTTDKDMGRQKVNASESQRSLETELGTSRIAQDGV